VTSSAVEVDSLRMMCGYLIMFGYTMFMLGKFNMVEQRAYLALAGIFAVGIGIMVSLGLTMVVGLYFTTIHGMLPFLALGR
jgi:Niemann-Pick C1 protein